MYTILIVDDIEANLYILRTLLEKNFDDIKIIETRDSMKALELATQENIDLLITDIQMPVMDGFELVNFLRKNKKTKEIPVIFATAIFDSDEYKLKGYSLGAYDYITKPINESIFIARLGNIIQNNRLQKILHEKEAYMKILLDSGSEGQIILDKHSIILNFNHNAQSIFTTITKGISFFSLLDGGVDEGVKSLKTFLNEVALNPHATSHFSHQKKYYKVAYKNYDTYHIILLFDVTHEVREGKKHEKILNTLNTIVLISNGKKVKSINHQFFNDFDFADFADFSSKHRCICELFIDKDPSVPHLMPMMENGAMWSQYVSNNPHFTHEAYMLDRHGVERAYEVKVSGIIFEEEEEEEEVVVVVFTDITLLKKQLKILMEQSRQSVMGEMISTIAHQWKQPLNIIGAYLMDAELDLQLGELTKVEYLKTIRAIELQVQFLSKTIQTFGNYMATNRDEEAFIVSEAIEEALSLLSYRILVSSIQIVKSNNAPIEIVGKKETLIHVVVNLITNSIDAFEENKISNQKISLSSCKDQENIIIEIHDTAGGIKEEEVTKIFDHYYSTKKAMHGTGIGLSIVKNAIENDFGGSVGVWNKEGGALFRIMIPIKKVKDV